MDNLTPEQIAAKTEADKQAKAQAKADAKAAKETAAKAKADAAAAKKAEKDAAKAAKDKEKADKAAAKTATARVKQPEQNGIRRPAPGSKCARIWELADTMSQTLKQPVTIGALSEACKPEGLNDATIRTQYARWKGFYGITGRITPPVAPAPAPAADAGAAAA
jgi:hypothetical protein